MSGHPYLYKVTQDGEWSDMVMLGCVWSWMMRNSQECSGVLEHGHTSSCAAVNGPTWSHVVPHGHTRSHVVPHGHRQSHMDPGGSGDTWSQLSVPTAWAGGAASSQLRVRSSLRAAPAFRGVCLQPGLAIDQGETPRPPEQPRINLCSSEGR